MHGGVGSLGIALTIANKRYKESPGTHKALNANHKLSTGILEISYRM